LAKGMVALFEARSDKIHPVLSDRIARHADSKRFLEIYDCGYLIQSTRLGGWRDRIGRQWNRFAHTINWRFNRIITARDGHEMLKLGALLPQMRDWDAGMEYFLKERAEKTIVNETKPAN